jgi:hypothetical protein
MAYGPGGSMIRSHQTLFGLIFGVILFSALSGYAQTQQDKARQETEEVAALREKAFKLIDTVAGQLNTLQSAENRARMGSNIVAALWTRDEEQARSLLRVVQEDIKTELQKREGEPRYDSRFNVFLKLRQDTIDRIARLDGQMALDFLRATHPVFDGDEPYGFREKEQALELRLAKQIAANHPDAALKLGRQSLENGFNRDVLSLLPKLNRKNKDQAQVLYKEMVEKVRDADLFNDETAGQFAQLLVQSFEPPDADASTYRDLIGILVTTALDKGCGKKEPTEIATADFCEWAATSIAAGERYDSRVARIKHWASRDHGSERSVFVFEEVRELLQDGAFDEVEALALKYPDFQVSMYQQAIFHAMSLGETDRMKKLIDRFPGDPERRQAMLAMVERNEKNETVPAERVAEIQKRLEEIPSGRVRVDYLLGTAMQLGLIDKKLAVKYLDQAGAAIEALKPGKEQTRMRISLALVYSLQKSDRGFAIMESLLPKLNELVDIAVKLDGYDTNYIRDGEWNMSANGSVGEILTLLSNRAGDFAWFDFDRAVSLASQFERPEIRMMAQLKLAQSILAGPQRRDSRTRVYVGYQ